MNALTRTETLCRARPPVRVLVVLGLCLLMSGCATKRPMLYPNDHLRRVGLGTAEQDIDACFRLARQYGLRPRGASRAAGRGVAGAVGGAITGAAVGAVSGSAGRDAAVGAAGGGAGGLVLGLFGARDPDPAFKTFVERSLRDSGYEVIGWR